MKKYKVVAKLDENKYKTAFGPKLWPLLKDNVYVLRQSVDLEWAEWSAKIQRECTTSNLDVNSIRIIEMK